MRCFMLLLYSRSGKALRWEHRAKPGRELQHSLRDTGTLVSFENTGRATRAELRKSPWAPLCPSSRTKHGSPQILGSKYHFYQRNQGSQSRPENHDRENTT